MGAVVIIFTLSLFAELVESFYLPGMYPLAHPTNSTLSAKVNSLTSVATSLPFSYYSLPFCEPPDGIKKADENFGEMLSGDLIENSPYKFRMLVTEHTVKVCDSRPLTADDIEHFRMRVEDMYMVNLLLDNLPVTTALIENNPGNIVTGFPIGFVRDGNTYVYNHLIFKVLVHHYSESGMGRPISVGDSAIDVIEDPGASSTNNTGYLVVGFEVAACSIARETDSKAANYSHLPSIDCVGAQPQLLKEGVKLVYTFDVLWEKSDIAWASRWDAYLKMNGNQVHWFSILNSIMVIAFLAGMVFVILLRSVHRDLAKIEQMDKEEAAQMAEESGWKLVVGDVFRPPSSPGMLCIVVGNGVQILCMAAVTIFFAALGFMSPASRGALLMGMVVLYLLLGIVAGYMAARLWVTLTGLPEGSVSLALKVSTFFPGISAIMLMSLNFLLWGSGSTGAVPLAVFFELFALWFLISVPLTIVGTVHGMRAERIVFPVRTNQIPRQIPEQKYPSWLLALGGGILPFGTLYIELFFIMSSMWMERVYYGFGFLFIVLILLVLVCAEVAVVFTYLQLTMEDYRWWWRSFLASGSVALYASLYSINYLVVELHRMSGTLSTIIYLGYSFMMVLAIFLSTGAVGFLASAYFVHYLFSSVKLD